MIRKNIFCDECITRWLSISKKCALCNINLEDLSISNTNKNTNVNNDQDGNRGGLLRDYYKQDDNMVNSSMSNDNKIPGRIFKRKK